AALEFMQQNGGQPPTGQEWETILKKARLDETLQALASPHAPDVTRVEALGLVLYPKSRFSPAELKVLGAYPVEGTDLVVARSNSDLHSNVSLLQESLAAGTLTYLSRYAPNALSSLLLTQRRAWEISRN